MTVSFAASFVTTARSSLTTLFKRSGWTTRAYAGHRPTLGLCCDYQLCALARVWFLFSPTEYITVRLQPALIILRATVFRIVVRPRAHALRCAKHWCLSIRYTISVTPSRTILTSLHSNGIWRYIYMRWLRLSLLTYLLYVICRTK
jgi:hypothetical protein